MDTIDKLTEIFKEFPGIGERQARRFVYFLMSRNSGYPENLAKTILDLKKDISQCRECFRFFVTHQNKDSVCEICTNPNINSDILMVIEKDSDLESVKKSRVYGGKYFILGGLVPIVEKNTKSYVRIEELKQRLKNNGAKEVILAFSLNPQGNHTDSYVRSELKNIAEEKG